MSIGKGFWFALGGCVLGCAAFAVGGLLWLLTFFWMGPPARVLGRVSLLGLLVGVCCLVVVALLAWRGAGAEVRRQK